MSRNLVLVLIFGLCIIGASFACAVTAYVGIQALGRNPGKNAPTIFVAIAFVLGFVFAIVSVVVMSANLLFTQ